MKNSNYEVVKKRAEKEAKETREKIHDMRRDALAGYALMGLLSKFGHRFTVQNNDLVERAADIAEAMIKKLDKEKP